MWTAIVVSFCNFFFAKTRVYSACWNFPLFNRILIWYLSERSLRSCVGVWRKCEILKFFSDLIKRGTLTLTLDFHICNCDLTWGSSFLCLFVQNSRFQEIINIFFFDFYLYYKFYYKLQIVLFFSEQWRISVLWYCVGN